MQVLQTAERVHARTLCGAGSPRAGGKRLSLWLTENNGRAVPEDRLDRVNEEPEDAKNAEEEHKTELPGHRVIHEQLTSICEKTEAKAKGLSARILRHDSRIHRLLRKCLAFRAWSKANHGYGTRHRNTMATLQSET